MASTLMVLVSIANPTYAHEDHPGQEAPSQPPATVAKEVAYRSTAIPERILLGWKGDPATSVAVTWRTDTSVQQAYGQMTLAEDGPNFVEKAKANQVVATTTLVKTDLGPRHYHAVNFENLTPNTLYSYRVGVKTNWSAWIHFKTASDKPEPFSFVYFGDAQNGLKPHWSRVFREAFSDAPRARFMLHAGDLVNRGNRDAEWGEWCAGGGWVNGMIPTIAIPGNHEYDKYYVDIPPEEVGKDVRHLCRRWRARFESPENGPADLLETCFYLDIQGVRIVGMNSMEDVDQQAKWLDGVLKNNPNRWTIVTHHHPIYSASVRRDNPELRNAWQPIYDKHHVDLVIAGHDHSYGRTGLRTHQENVATGVSTQRKESGTVYVVSVSGPKQYDRNDNTFVRRAEDTQLYQIISIEGDELRYVASTATGVLYDAFKLRKQPGKVNQLINQVPDTPENRRPDQPEAAKTEVPDE